MRDGGTLTIARADWRDAYPEKRRLTNDPNANAQKMAAQEALLASGGVCGPIQVDFNIPFFSSADRPLADALPSFNAERGGVRYVLPAAFTSGAGGTTIWSEAADANPGAATKPVVTLSCPAVQEIFVDAVPTRVKLGNLQSGFAPEVVESFTKTAFAYAARVQDLNRLSKISASSTLVSSGQLLGASRDLLATFDQASAAYPYRTRIPRTQRISLILPDWLKDMLRADLTRQLTVGTASDDSLALSDERISSWFSVRNLSPIWILDGQPAVTGALTAVAQSWGSQSANAVLNGWPTQVVWWMFAEGSFQRLDGGMMEFGAIRDSTLDAANDVELFTEIFENVAFRGLESLEVVSTVKANGASAAGIATANSVIY